MMRIADAIMFYTDQEVEEYKSNSGKHDRRPITALNNGIDLEPVRLTRRLPYIASDRPRDLLFIGRITPKSELGLAIEALAHPECDTLTLDIIGDGPQTKSQQQYARHLGVDDRIAWHGASIDPEFIGEIANKCKAFVYPGAVGLSLIHGLAYGLPAIIHNARWRHMPEIAAHLPGTNGVNFEYRNVKALAEVIENLLNSPAELESMSRACVETVENSFNTRDMARRFVSFVQDVNANG